MKSVALFDADGVLTLPEEVFSVVYSRSRGLDHKAFETFFRGEWSDFVTGKRDLKQAITENPTFWQWDGDADSLLEYWCKTEDVRNQPLIELIHGLGERGIACYLATEQEKYRAEYMKLVMFKDVFKGYFVTAEIGYKKSQPEFYEYILGTLQAEYPGISSTDIAFFDDSQSKVDTALSAGIDAHLYVGVEQVRDFFQH